MTTSTRLPVDDLVLGYWGFDEANVGDPALDETTHARDLTVSDAVSVVPARLGNGRQFNGTTSKAVLANPAHDAFFRLGAGDPLTIIVWVTLDSVLQTGSQRRTIVAFEGASGTMADHTLYRITVSNDGSIRYEHQDGGGGWAELATAPGQLRTGRYYSLVVTRETIVTFNSEDPDALPVLTSRVKLYLNNKEVAWATATYLGAPTEQSNFPVVSDYGQASRLCIGYSLKRADAYWHGVLDELSIHDAIRKKTPYLDAAYYRLTLATAFNRITSYGDIRTVGSVEMGGGTRWWCYERDGSLFVIRENTLGLYSKEILLTTGGTSPTDGSFPTGYLQPGGAEQPRLVYDPATDALLVVFTSAGKLYRVTANSGDQPATQNMPNTGSTTTIVKSNDVDSARLSAGETKPVTSYADEGVLPASITLFEHPVAGYGVAVVGTNAYGYAIFEEFAGHQHLHAMVPLMQSERLGLSYYFTAISTRKYGARYFAVPLLRNGWLSSARSSPVVDYLGLPSVDAANQLASLTFLTYGRYGDAKLESATFSGGDPATLADFTVVNSTPVKAGAQETPTFGSGEQTPVVPFVVTSWTPVKSGAEETMTPSAGDSTLLSITRGAVRIDL